MLEAIALAAVPVCIASVWDGDSLTTCRGEKVRLVGIDTPELPGSPSCRGSKRRTHWCGDTRLAYRARDELRRLVASGSVRIERRGVDRFGRTLATVRVDGVDVGRVLIGLRLAREWK